MALNLPPEEIPTALAVAAAVVAAARVLGEDPQTIAIENGWARCRWPAVEALSIFYPQVPITRLGAYVGALGAGTTRLKAAKSAAWWDVTGQQAVAAAVAALEQF